MIDQHDFPNTPRPRVALAHDWLVGMRGGEWVLDRLAQLFGPTDLYTLVSNGTPLTQAISQCRVIASPLQRFPGASGSLRRHYLPLMPWAVGRLRVAPGSCDVLMSTSSAVMKAIVPPAGVPHVCYCHSPARYLWDLGEDYARGAGGFVRRIGLSFAKRPFQRWDRRTADRVTRFIANSTFTAGRIRACYGREAEVIHPPVRTDFFTPDSAVSREDWYLVVSALEPYKRVDLAIDAAHRKRVHLRIAGDGSQRHRLQSLAGPTVQLFGRVSDEQLRDLYRRARALIFPQVEDFGIIAAEAQACGCPVIAFERGGALDIVLPGTGLFFKSQTTDALIDAIDQYDRAEIDPARCVTNAARFAESKFDEAIVRCISRTLRDQS